MLPTQHLLRSAAPRGFCTRAVSPLVSEFTCIARYRGMRAAADYTLLGLLSSPSLLAGHSYACMAFFAHELTHGAILKRGPVRRTLEEGCGGLTSFQSHFGTLRTISHHVETNPLHDPDRRFVENERNLRNMMYGVALYPSRKTLRWNPLVFIQFLVNRETANCCTR